LFVIEQFTPREMAIPPAVAADVLHPAPPMPMMKPLFITVTPSGNDPLIVRPGVAVAVE
jgi:hypothetical protein